VIHALAGGVWLGDVEAADKKHRQFLGQPAGACYRFSETSSKIGSRDGRGAIGPSAAARKEHRLGS
jgi:hypothetical protein